MTELRPDVNPDVWRGAVGWETRDDGAARVWRLLPEQVGRAFAPGLLEKAREAAGVRVDVVTDAGELRLDLDLTLDLERDTRLDVVVDGVLHERADLDVGRSVTTVALPAGEHRVQAWLPQVGEAWVHSLTLDGNAEAAPATPVRWTTYGSSITQCSAAAGPAETWPAIVARELDWDLTCLGFGGQCHLDPLAVRTIEAIPADVVSLCLGINIQGGATLSDRTFGPLVADLLDRTRAAHPHAVIAVITPIVSPPRESTRNGAGLDLVTMRAILSEVVEQTPGVHLIDGPSMIGHDDQHLLPDDLHPDAEGYRLMGERLAAALGSLGPR